jgi:hypothetical protein
MPPGVEPVKAGDPRGGTPFALAWSMARLFLLRSASGAAGRVLPWGHSVLRWGTVLALLLAVIPGSGASSALADDEKKPKKPPVEETDEEAGRRDGKGKKGERGEKGDKGEKGGKDGGTGKPEDADSAKRKDPDEKPPRKSATDSGDAKPAPKAATPPPPAKDPPPKPPAETAAFATIAAEWLRGDAAAIAARLPARGRITLALPDVTAGSYRAEQARSLLVKYFRSRTFSAVTVKGVQDRVATCETASVRSADRRRETSTLVLTLGTEDGHLVLVGVRDGGATR